MTTLIGIDRNVHTSMSAVSPCTDTASGTWKLGDTLPLGDDIASTAIAVGPDFSASLEMTLVRADTSTGDSTVKMFRRYLDGDGNVLDSYTSESIAVTAVEGTYSMTLPCAPAGTESCVLGIQSNMTPPGNPVRTNLFQDPRCTTLTNFYTRYSWDLAVQTAASDLGIVAGLKTYAQVQATGSSTGTGRGINLYDSTDRSTPLGNPGYPVTGLAGQTLTISAYVYATKACTMQASARGYAGTVWTAAAASGSSVSVSANTWTRLSVAVTVPAGATDLCVTFMATNSIAWVAGDQIRMSAVLFESGSSLNPYFDGNTVGLITPPASAVWEGNTNNSNSLLWAAVTAGGTTVQALGSVLTYSASAEELIGAALERDYRRSVADIFNAEQSLITAGTPGLLSGSLTFLCSSLAQALGVDAVYRMPGLVTLDSEDELNGLTHRAVSKARITPERVLAGKSPKWLVQVEFREQGE